MDSVKTSVTPLTVRGTIHQLPVEPATCSECDGQRGFKRQCGGFLSDWVWEMCRACNGRGVVQVAPQRPVRPESVEIPYDQLWSLIAGAKSYVVKMRRQQRTEGFNSWAVAADVDHVEEVARLAEALLRKAEVTS